MKRALSVAQCLSMRDDPLPMSPLWRAAVGEPELGTVWMVWGVSGSGKTSFALALCKEMCRMGYRVAYDSMEEGASKSFSDALVRERMDECGRQFVVLDNMPMDELAAWMERRRSADVVVIDSLQYSGMKYRDYKTFRDRFRGRMIVVISHADGKEPQGATGKSVRYDASVKVYVEGHKAFARSRYGGGEPYIIWPEEAARYWGPGGEGTKNE